MSRARAARQGVGLWGLLIVLVVGATATASADWRDQGPVLTIIEENDLVVRTDRHYTQGLRLSFLQSDGGAVADWLAARLPAIGFGGSEHLANKLGFELGQSIFTPADLRATQLLKDDRPYAGWLYTGVILQRRWMMSGRWPTLENFQVDVGIIGPHSLAEEAQTWVHEVRGIDTPKGWRNQLHDEPGLALKYQRSWLLSPTASGPRYLDLIPHVGMSLGNVDTSFRIGSILRLGWNLPDDFGVTTISSLATTEGGWSKDRPEERRRSIYMFLGSEASTVAYTAFLDGNLFRHSHHVEKEPFVAEWKVGLGGVWSFADVAFSYVYRTPQFVGQRKNDAYGSLSVKIKF